jgi:hypothetical protein
VAEWQFPLIDGPQHVFVPVFPEGVEYIAQNLRKADEEEIFATCGHRRYADALRVSLAASEDAVIGITVFGEPAAILGVTTTSVIESIGCPWMVATPKAERYRRAFIECGRAYTAAMLERYERLENYIDARHVRNIAWLRHLGYHVGDAVPHGVFGAPFRPFSLTR